MKKKIIRFSILFVLIFGGKTLIAQTKASDKIVGADVDKHGCKPSAGYTWSTLRNECVRIFELTSIDKNAIALLSIDKTQQMVVIFSANKLKAEIFYKEGTFVVNKTPKEESYLLKKGKIVIGKLFHSDKKWKFVKINNKLQEVTYQ